MSTTICKKAEDDSSFGKIKLLKLLAYSDFLSFLRTGAPITGATYIKLEHRPAPKQLPGALELLAAKGEVESISQDVHGYTQTRYVANRDPDTEHFTDEQMAIADQVLNRFWADIQLKMMFEWISCLMRVGRRPR